MGKLISWIWPLILSLGWVWVWVWILDTGSGYWPYCGFSLRQLEFNFPLPPLHREPKNWNNGFNFLWVDPCYHENFDQDDPFKKIDILHLCIWIESDWHWTWTCCVWSWGQNCWLRSSGLGWKGFLANAGMIFLFLCLKKRIQFTICSSATSDALLTNLHFFTILRQSGNPWISFDMAAEDRVFKLTVTHNF